MRHPSGIPRLDEILHGGLVKQRTHLVRGGPGTGKTTLGLQFLAAGLEQGEPALLITLEADEAQLRTDAARIGLHLDDLTILDLSPTPEFFAENRSYDIFSAADVERDPTTRKIIEAVARLKPTRVFVDTITTLRYLAPDAFQFRKQARSFLRYLVESGATVLMSSEPTVQVPDDDLCFMSDAIIELGMTLQDAMLRRTLTVMKLRGSAFEGGRHSLDLTSEGIVVFPRLIPTQHSVPFVVEVMPSGLAELDKMIGGGIERGTITLLSGPTGVGKTTLGMQFIREAARRGERSVVFAFEEHVHTMLHRCESIGMPANEMLAAGTLQVVEVEPLRYSPDEFATMVRDHVEQRAARVVMVDGVAGYRLSLTGDDLAVHLHALGRYLKNMGVTVIFISEAETITGDFRATELGISYLVDNLLFMRYLEIDGELHKAIGVLKKRLGDFQRTLREISITARGIVIGEPLTSLRGLLTGTPEWVDRKHRRDSGREHAS